MGRNAGYAAIDEDSQIMKDKYIADAIQEVFAVNELEYRSRLDKAKNRTSTKTTVRNYVLYAMANSEKNTMTTQGILSAVNDLRDGEEMRFSSLSPVLTKLKGPDLEILTSDDRNYWHFSDPMFKAYVREHKDELLLKKTTG
ncbi:hypothetical protein ACFP1C_12120 [Levilactobacillus fujinensis]|uniref:Uncharacterized protein n=2 Tax=Levilactobacillus fujinensis TaxID=2486024 RepID=A0ABW1TJ02_9LACO